MLTGHSRSMLSSIALGVVLSVVPVLAVATPGGAGMRGSTAVAEASQRANHGGTVNKNRDQNGGQSRVGPRGSRSSRASSTDCIQPGPGLPAGICYLAPAVLDPSSSAGPVVDPTTVARAAVARLQLAAPTPTVGPPPSINKWKMAAVGYPLWLWVEGDTSPAPVTDTNGPLSVSLRAHVTGITFDMGDGHTVSCTGGGSRWTRDVAAGTPSPTCGYRYRKPSLPDGSYTITATTRWAVDWNINGTTGTIPYSQTATTSLPVGELQVLVR